ncbi:Peptidase c19, ubiquitin-specific peptidase, dusp domain, partial [Globisporangium splendens]
MMKLWRRRASSEEEETEVELSDVDLERGFDASASLSPAHNGVIFGRPPAEERRRLERELILQYDTRELKRGDAWILIETSWLDAWMAYILSEDDPDCPVVKPGPLTNYSLFDPKEYCLKKGLVATTHYRGVNPQVYALYAELYGTAGAKPIARWTLDIYATPVMIDDVREMLRVPELKARVEVTALNDKFETQEDRESRHRKHGDNESFLYRCCCRCELLIPCLGRLLVGPSYMSPEKKNQKSRDRRRRRRSQRKRRRSYDYDQSEEDGDSEDDSDSDAETETRGLLR